MSLASDILTFARLASIEAGELVEITIRPLDDDTLTVTIATQRKPGPTGSTAIDGRQIYACDHDPAAAEIQRLCEAIRESRLTGRPPTTRQPSNPQSPIPNPSKGDWHGHISFDEEGD